MPFNVFSSFINKNTPTAARRFHPGGWNVVWLLVFCLLGAIGPLEAADPPKARYEKALELARSGRHEAALPILRQLTEEFPKEPFYLYDYMAVLGWAGQDKEVLSLRSRVDLEKAPPYLLETLGRSARNLKDYPSAIQFYQRAMQRAPDRVESSLGLARSYIESGDHQKAIDLLQRLDQKQPERIDILEALAEAHRLNNNRMEALAVYQHILRIHPNDRESQRQQILIISQLGAPHLAASMAREKPELLSREEFESIVGDQAAQSMRWGGLYSRSPGDRFQDTDAAVQLLEDQIRRLKEQDQTTSKAYQRARFDLLSAYRDRQRTKDVIALYEALAVEGVEIPDYILLAAAEAYSQEGDPERARDIYRQILERDPDNFDAGIGLFYVYFDLGEDVSAMRLINRLADKQSDPARKRRAESISIKGEAWSGQLAEAQHRLEPLVERAPNNPSLHSELGYVYLWRGWPRQAKEEFQLSNAINPEGLDAQIGEIAAQRDLYEFGEAKENMLRLEESDPDNNQIRRLRRSWEIHNMRELRVAFSGRHNSGSVEGTRDLTLDIALFSRPIEDHYRIFAHGLYNRSEFPEGNGLYRRIGAGVEYRARDVKIEGELSTGARPDTELGLSLRAHWMPDDYWTWGAALDTYSNDVPLRGRLNEELKGWSVGLSADYRFHESRSIGAGLQLLEFSDDNRRVAYSLVGLQRLISRPAYRLDGRLGFYGSSNTLENASYYNPRSDLTAEVSLTNEWPLFRRGSRSLVHRLGLMLGTYFEKGFGSKGTWGLNYEHEWNLTDRLNLVYGIGRFRPVYDGVAETSIRYYLTLDWRF